MTRMPTLCRCIIFFAASLSPLTDAVANNKDNLMEEVVVVASKIERPLARVASQVTVLHRDDLDRLQLQSLTDIARYQAALEAEYQGNRFGSTGLSIRGIGGNRVAMELDGVPLPSQFSVGAFASNSKSAVDPAILDRVEVLRGPASSLYGSDAIGGVVILETVNPGDLIQDGENLYFGGGGGWFDATNSHLMYGTTAFEADAHSFLVTLDHRQGHESDNLSEGIADDKTDTHTYHGLAKWRYDLNNGDHVEALFDSNRKETKSDLRSVLGFGRQYANTISLRGDDQQERNRFSVNYQTHQFGPIDMADILVYSQSNTTRQLTYDLRSNPARSLSQRIDREFRFKEKSRGIEAKLRKDLILLNSQHLLVAGLEWDRQKINESRDGLQTDLNNSSTTKILPPGELLPTRDLPESNVDQMGLYIQDEIQLGSWTLIPALRWDRYRLDASNDQLVQRPASLTDLDENSMSAKFGIVWSASEALSLYAHYAEGFRSPPAADVNLVLEYTGSVLVRSLPNPELKSETSHNYEFGLRYRGVATKLDWAFYQSEYDNFIESRARVGVDLTDGALLFQSRNIQESTIYGSELDATFYPGNWHPGLQSWSANLGVHWARGKDESTDEPINSISPTKTVVNINWAPNLKLNARLAVTRLNKQTNVDFSSGVFYVPGAATTVDLSLQYAPQPWVEVHFGFNNLTNRKYERYNDVRDLSINDPRIEQLSRPGRNFAVTFHIRPM